MYRECSKSVNECSYRYDYRGCNKIRCPFANEYEEIRPQIVNEVIENNYTNYKSIKLGNYCSVGKINNRYAFKIITSANSIPEYYPISKEEFDTFEEWKNDIGKIVKDIKNRNEGI